MEKKRKIQIVTGSRGEWGYIRPIIKLIEKDPTLAYELIATNMHLLPEFGYSIQEIEKEAKVTEAVYMALSGSNNTCMAKSLAIFMSSYTDTLERTKPCIVLLAGDRGEQLMACTAAAYMNIPVAHIQAGEVSGNIDGAVRHAITKIAHLHFAATQDAHQRLLRMGEQKFRCFQTGAPQLDDFLNSKYDTVEQVRKKYRLKKDEKFLLLLQHSVTYESAESYHQTKETLLAARQTGMRCLVILPYNDAGSVGVRDALNEFGNANFTIERNVSRATYGGLLSTAEVLVGNSSSALIEAPSFHLPAVNIGNRQRGRERGINVIDCEGKQRAIFEAIQKALSPAFKKSVQTCVSPYGDGKSSEKILKILKSITIDKKLLEKTLTY